MSGQAVRLMVRRNAAFLLLVTFGLGGASAVWAGPARAAGAEAAATCNPPAPGTTCGQAVLSIDAATGAVTSADPLAGANSPAGDFDAIECRGAPAGTCFLAAHRGGKTVLASYAIPASCSSSQDPAVIGTLDADGRVARLAFDTADGKLYAAIGGRIGTVDTATGAFAALGASLGSGTGAAGSVDFTGSGINAVTFDAATNSFLAVLDRGAQSGSAARDVLFRIDPSTGSAVGSFGGGAADYVEITPVGGRNEVAGILVTGGLLYATMNHADTDAHLVTVDTATGGSSDIGPQGVDKVKTLSQVAGGGIRGLSGTAGASVPCQTPTPTPTPTATPAPTETPTVSPTVAAAAPPAPPTEVLGVAVRRPAGPQPVLPVTGADVWRLVLGAALCYALGGVALTLAGARRRAPAGTHAPRA